MSYNYDELVTKIQHYRFQIYEKVKSHNNEKEENDKKDKKDKTKKKKNRNEDYIVDESYEILLSQLLEVYETLSNHCPMTVLLWMQYGQIMYMYSKHIASSIDTNYTTGIYIDIESYNKRIDILELGLIEFPGSVILQLHYIEILMIILIKFGDDWYDLDSDEEMENLYQHINKMNQAIQNAIEYVGLGSHYNEDHLIILLYKHQRTLYRYQYQMCLCEHDDDEILNDDYDFEKTTYYMDKIFQSYINQSRVPMKVYNDDILNEVRNEFVLLNERNEEVSKDMEDDILQSIDMNRRSISKIYSNRFITNDDNIMIQMKDDKIWFDIEKYNIKNNHNTNNSYDSKIDIFIQWDDTILCLPTTNEHHDNSTSNNAGMGLGSLQLANLFIGYARGLHTYHIPKHSSLNNKNKNKNDHDSTQTNNNNDNDDEAKYMNQLSFSVYERGIVECPTIEIIWLSYIRSLCETIISHSTNHNTNNNNETTLNELCQKLQSVCHRAVRNCPYSILLIQQQLMSYYYLAECNVVVFDPDQLLNCITNAHKTKFISIVSLIDLYITAIRVTKRRILSLLSKWNGGRICINKEDVSNKDKNNKKVTSTKKLLQYDDSEQPPSDNDNKNSKNKKNKDDSGNTSNNGTILEEIKDLSEDLRDMYSEVENRIKMAQPTTNNNNNIEQEVPFSSTYYRALLLKERSITESLLLIPLLDNGLDTNNTTSTESSTANKSLTSIIRSWDKCLKAHNPPHPDLYLHYIRHYINKIVVLDCSGITPTSIVSHIRHIRYLYEKAIINVGNPNIMHNKKKNNNKKDKAVVFIIPQSNVMPYRDYDIALSNLCHEWIEFEQSFGSDRSLFYANKIIQKKIEKSKNATTIAPAATSKNTKEVTVIPSATTTTTTLVTAANNKKHETMDESNSNESIVQSNELVEAGGDRDEMLKKRSMEMSTIFPDPSNKKQKTNHNHDSSQIDGDSAIVNDSSINVSETTNPDQQPFGNNNIGTSTVNSSDETIKVKVGNLEYPAHPYTVRVSSLHPDAEDMDLVDVFKNICGPIVHARLIRNKDNHSKLKHPRHKGWGLVQFEDRDSVLKALELNDVISVREKLITIERSHMPAVSLIPPGMHRISPVGEGKVSKRNLKARNKSDVKLTDPQNQQHDPIMAQSGGGKNSDHDLSDDRDHTLEPASAAAFQFETKTTSFVPTPSTNILAFRPRGVRNLNQKKQKVSLDLGTAATKPEA